MGRIYFYEHNGCQNLHTKEFGSNANIRELYSGDAGLNLVGTLPSLTKVVVVSLILYGQLPEYYLKIGHDHLYRNNSNSLFTYHPNTRCYIN
jgi:hypothetical protein